MKLIRALPDTTTRTYNRFTEQETLAISEDLDGVPMVAAQSHCMLSQRRCSVVRERRRGPKGGRGAFQYNVSADGAWPAAWRPNKDVRYYIVEGVMPPFTSTKVQTTQVQTPEQQRMGESFAKTFGLDIGTIDDIHWEVECVVEEAAPVSREAWRDLPYHKR